MFCIFRRAPGVAEKHPDPYPRPRRKFQLLHSDAKVRCNGRVQRCSVRGLRVFHEKGDETVNGNASIRRLAVFCGRGHWTVDWRWRCAGMYARTRCLVTAVLLVLTCCWNHRLRQPKEKRECPQTVHGAESESAEGSFPHQRADKGRPSRPLFGAVISGYFVLKGAHTGKSIGTYGATTYRGDEGHHLNC